MANEKFWGDIEGTSQRIGARSRTDAQLEEYKDKLKEVSETVQRQKICMEVHTDDARNELGEDSQAFKKIDVAASKILGKIMVLEIEAQRALDQVSVLRATNRNWSHIVIGIPMA